jgi:hypothetical protein
MGKMLLAQFSDCLQERPAAHVIAHWEENRIKIIAGQLKKVCPI